MSDLRQANEQAVKAARYFESVLREHGQSRVGVRVGTAVFVIAIDRHGDMLEKATAGTGFLPDGISNGDAFAHWLDNPVQMAPPGPSEGSGPSLSLPVEQPKDPLVGQVDVRITGVLVARYHAPPPEHASKGGKIHLHVGEDVKLKRRTRLAGECLCSKKHGSNEQPPNRGSEMCAECVKVAADNSLGSSLD